MKGRVRKFGHNVDTDSITPGDTLHLPLDELKKHAFRTIVDKFYQTVGEDDIIVAGRNFGCGSSREQATEVVRELGIHVIVCESMARVYFRNCIALGVYPIICKGVSSYFDEGDEIEINFPRAEIKNLLTGKIFFFNPLSGLPKEIYEHGGILEVLKEKLTNM